MVGLVILTLCIRISLGGRWVSVAIGGAAHKFVGTEIVSSLLRSFYDGEAQDSATVAGGVIPLLSQGLVSGFIQPTLRYTWTRPASGMSVCCTCRASVANTVRRGWMQLRLSHSFYPWGETRIQTQADGCSAPGVLSV